MPHYVGIDGGGTKTAICAVSGDGSPVRRSVTGSSSWLEYGVREVAQSLRDAVGALLGGDYGEIAGIAMGIPYYGESAEGNREVEEALRELFTGIPLYLTNDVEVGWAGSLALRPGINIVAGTGSIAFGEDRRGNTARSGGWSEFFGDEGSCYWMGRMLMGLFSKQADGRLPRDELYDTVHKELGLRDDFSLIGLIQSEYSSYRERVASLQLLAEKAALAGSGSVRELYREAVRELCQMVTAVRAKLDFPEEPWTVSYSGGLFKAGELVVPRFTEEIERAGGQVQPPRFSPVEGAVLLAVQRFFPDGLARIKEAMRNADG